MKSISDNAAALYGNKKGDWYDGIYFGMFTGGYITSAIKNSQEASEAFKTYTKSIEKGYTSLQSMAIKTGKAGIFKIFGAKDEYVSLKDLAPQIFNSDGTLNADAIRTALEEYNDIFSEEQIALLNYLLGNIDAYNSAQLQTADYLTTIFGDMASTVADSMIEAFKSTGNAAIDLGNIVGGVAEKMASDLIQSLLINDIFKKYEADILALYDPKSTDYIADPTERTKKALSYVDLAMAEVDKRTPEYKALYEGITGEYPTTETSLTGMSKAVASMSEDSAKVIGSYLNSGLMQWVKQTKLQEGMGTTLSSLYDIQNQALLAINAIKTDTGKLVTSNEELVGTMKSVLAGTGARSLSVKLV
jgi:hypothetical protein